jgi:hypothetical protein
MTAATTTQPRAVLVTPRVRSVLTTAQSVDTKTAITRALKEYLVDVVIGTEPEGRTVKFRKVFDVWAEPEDVGEWPSATINPLGEVEYDAPDMNSRPEEIAPNVVLRRWANAKLQVQVHCWANNPEDRLILAMAMEDAMNPNDDDTYGFLMDVPYYFNARARFTPRASMYEDDGESAQKRWRKVVFTLDAEIPAYRLIGRKPYLIPRATTTVE